jgi:hypothetical protein
VHVAPGSQVPPPVIPPAPPVPDVAPAPPPSGGGTPPSTPPDIVEPDPLAIGSVPSGKQHVASKPSAVSVHEDTFAPTKRAHGFPSAQRGGGGQLDPPPLELPAHVRPVPVFTQTGAWGPKHHAPMNPLAVSVQFCNVAPG